jgi:hypothetical protein
LWWCCLLLLLWYYFFFVFFLCVACYVLVILDNDFPGGEGGDEVADVLRKRNSATAGRRKHARALSASELLSRQNTTAGLYPTSALLTVITYQMMFCLLYSPTQIVKIYQTYERSMDFPCLRYFPSFGSKTRCHHGNCEAALECSIQTYPSNWLWNAI